MRFCGQASIVIAWPSITADVRGARASLVLLWATKTMIPILLPIQVLLRCKTAISGQQKVELVQKDSHAAGAVRAAFTVSKTAINCSRRTEGKSSRKESIE